MIRSRPMGAHDHGSLPVKEALDEDALTGAVSWRCLALAIAGTFCALASVAENAGQSSETSNGLWGRPVGQTRFMERR